MLRSVDVSAHRHWPVRGRAADVVLSIGALATVAGLGGSELDPLGWTLAAAASVVLYFRRSHPMPVALFTLAVCAVYYPLSEADGPVWPALVVALYTVAAEAQLIAAVVLTAVALLAFAFSGYRTGTPHLADAAAFLLGGWFAAAVAMGAVVHNRRAYLREAEERKEEELLLRAAEERLRIARELHDTLGHHISLIHVQASAALHRLQKQSDRAPGALTAIKETSKDALRELRTTLGVLRQGEPKEPTAEAPGLARLGKLVDSARSTGLDVTLEIEGAPRPVAADVDLAGFRIVQESLTNVTRHASATQVVVRVRYGDDEIDLRIDDNGRGGSGDVTITGTGLRGMAERARGLGGEFTAAGRPGGGFGVNARLPVEKWRRSA